MADKQSDTPKEIAKARRAQTFQQVKKGAAAAAGLAMLGMGYVAYDTAFHSESHLSDAYQSANIQDMAVYLGRVNTEAQDVFIRQLIADDRLDIAAALDAQGKFSDDAKHRALLDLYDDVSLEEFAKITLAVTMPQSLVDTLFAVEVGQGRARQADFLRRVHTPSKPAAVLKTAVEANNRPAVDYLLGSGLITPENASPAFYAVMDRDNDVLLSVLLDKIRFGQAPVGLVEYALQHEKAAAMRIILDRPEYSFTAEQAGSIVRQSFAVAHPKGGALDLLLTRVSLTDETLAGLYYAAAEAQSNKGASGDLYAGANVIAAHMSSDAPLYAYLKQNTGGGGLLGHIVEVLRQGDLFDGFFARAILERDQKLARSFLVGEGVTPEDVVRVYAGLIADGHQAQVEWSAAQTQTRNDITAQAVETGTLQAATKILETTLLSGNNSAIAALRKAAATRDSAAIPRIMRDAGVNQTDIRDAFLDAIRAGQTPVYIFMLDRLGVTQSTLDEAIDLAFEEGEAALVRHCLNGGLLTPEALGGRIDLLVKGGKARQAADVVGALDLSAEQQAKILPLFDAPMQRAIRNLWTPR